MTKRMVCLLVVFCGVGLFTALVSVVGLPAHFPYQPSATTILAQMIFWGSVSAAVAAARTPGKWNEPLEIGEARPGNTPRWLWPLFFVVLAVVNYFIAIAVLLGATPFSPRSNTRSTEAG